MQRPTQYISYIDLKKVGWDITFNEKNSYEIEEDVHFDYEVVNLTYNGRRVTKEDLERYLQKLGLDLKCFNLTVTNDSHRPLSDPTRVVCAYRFSAPERVDRGWLNSGYASKEAKYCVSNMKDMNHVLQRMANGGYK